MPPRVPESDDEFLDDAEMMEMGTMGLTTGKPVVQSPGGTGVRLGARTKPGLLDSVKTYVGGLMNPETENSLRSVSFISQAADRLHISATLLVAAFVGSLILLLILKLAGFTMNIVVDILGFVYPVYMSYKAINTEDTADDKQWLTYWVVYGFLQLVEKLFFLEYLIPLYFLFKLLFLWYCACRGGATHVYKHVIQPSMSQYEQRIDESIDSLSRQTNEAGTALTNIAISSGVSLAAAAQSPSMQ